MSDYRRAFLKGGTFFFTVVTYSRRPVFRHEASVGLLMQCLESVMETRPFRIDALVILPDHLHTIWTLPDDEFDFSTRWKLVKGTFTHRYSGREARHVPESMLKKGEKGVWQRRFWEHAIRDQEDFNRHCDYIHYNPVKHGLANAPAEWKHSSFSTFVDRGTYASSWGVEEPVRLSHLDYE